MGSDFACTLENPEEIFDEIVQDSETSFVGKKEVIMFLLILLIWF